MAEIFAGRFMKQAGGWIDLASGSAVRMRISTPGAQADQLAWSSRCAMLAGLRHPLVNPLLDFGIAGPTRAFEAYTEAGAFRASRPDARRLQQHLARFFDTQGLAIPSSASPILRPHETGRVTHGRPIGLVLQRRAVLDAVGEVLDVARPGGASVIEVRGPAACGLRTLRVLVARMARTCGYVPVGSTTLCAYPWLVDHLHDRHVCVLVDSDGQPGIHVARFLARLSAAGARRHVVLMFSRASHPGRWRALHVEPLGVTAMTAMVFRDPDEGPSQDELLLAARRAEGRPGLLLSLLGAEGYDRPLSGSSVVHERPQDYVVQGPAPRPSESSAPAAAIGLRAARRGEALARDGRHASAMRVLTRASRLLRARGDRTVAARCAELRGWLALDRARTDLAVRAFEETRDVCPEGAASVSAAMGIGIAWTEDGRLSEGEAALRNALMAARSIGEHRLAVQAIAALGRCLYWQGRFEEAAVALTDGFDGQVADADRSAIAGVSARVHLIEGATVPAIRAARQAVQLATTVADLRAQASARRVLAATLLAAGDLEHSHEQIAAGLRDARRARLPLAAVRLRLVLLDLLASAPADRVAVRRLAARLMAASARLPRLLGLQTRAACARALEIDVGQEIHAFIRATGAVALDMGAGHGHVNPVAELEAFLEIGRSASDDRAALDRMCDDVLQKARGSTVMVVAGQPEARVLAISGRPWPGDPHVAWRALAGGCSVPADPRVEPCQCAEPLRYGGLITGAVACRWVAGTAIDAGRSQGLLRFVALALAPHVRALLDQVMAVPGGATWKELLGESGPARALRDSVTRAARAPFPVLIEGESGSGKELVARAIHRIGQRRDRRFCAINCAALSDDLLEAELFGHVRGAFTGAVGDRPGLFEDADGGTLFLDEIGELSARAQAKLLRVLQDGEVRRVGENVSRRVDVRVVAATNRRLEEEVAAGRFRADLRFRLDVVRIEVPPLRERASDVPILASHFWTDAAARVGSRATLSPEALAALSRYDWPGNVRELQNVIAWMAVHSPIRGRVGSAALPGHLARAAAPVGSTFEAAREDFERRFVRAALATANGHRVRAAASLGVTRQGLAKMLRRLQIDRDRR